MDVLRKAVKRSPKPFGKSSQPPQSSKQHKKLPENWTDTREPVKDGMTFYLKYIGSTLVEELDDGESYGDKISSNAVTTIVNMNKMSGKKLSKVSLTISTRGISVVDMETKEIYVEHSIYRICFCTADREHDKVFAYIARNTDNETIGCYAFVCPKKKVAEAVTLTMAQTFNLAREEEENQQTRYMLAQAISNLNLQDKDSQNSSITDSPASSSGSSSPATGIKSHQQQDESDLVEKVQAAFDEEDEFSSLALSRHQKDQGGAPIESGFSSSFRYQPESCSQSVATDLFINNQQSSNRSSRAVPTDDLLCL